MKNKIKQFSKGDFKLEQPDIRFSETQILMSVSEGEVYQGSFLIENQKDGNIRGLVYPSSFRVHCIEQGFEGNPVKVNFTYDSTGLVPGQMEQGKFTVVCNGGEYDLAFTAVVEKPYIMTSCGKVQSLSDFKKLAAADFTEARRLFRTRQFYDILKYEDRRIRNLYENMRKWSLDEQALEEFLVGIKQKEKIFLTLSEEECEFRDVLEAQKIRVEITKNTWGYAPIRIRCVGDFLQVNQTEITTEDFVGNTYRLEYIIQKEKLHAGYNYGKIEFITPYETLTLSVNVHQSVTHDDLHGMTGMIAGQALKEYLACLSGRMPLGEWAEKALKHVSQLRDLEPDNEYYMLLQAHIYLRGRREEEAKWILENGNFPRFAIGRKPEINAYYLFLTALLRKETLYTNKVLEELNRMYMKSLHSWPLLCMIINLDPKYKDYSDRLRVLERQFFNGANRVLLYAEAYICFQEKVLLLRKLDSFEMQILNFATKYKMLTRELALRLADLACQQKSYDKKLLRILERAYSMYEEPRLLHAICMQLIKGNKTGVQYFTWYQKAVEQEMKLAQLYEYYMMSMNPQRVKGAFPKIVYLYFLHGINLDYKRTALLYENILLYEDEQSEIYGQYKEQIKAFAWEQLMERHINDSLRVIYNRFINEKEITLDGLDALYDICHAYRVTTKMRGMKYVLVIEKDGSVRQRVAYRGEEGAKVYLYDKDARIVWEGDNGLHYADSIPYETRRLLYEMKFLEMCKMRMTTKKETEQDGPSGEVSFENIKRYGMKAFDTQEIFLLCSKRIREQENMEDDFLLYLSFELLKDGLYDKALLNYLAHFYCGATCDMKMVWQKAREYGVRTKGLAERIITQMIFSEVMFQEEEIFEDYYAGKPYFRLKQAYLAYVSRLYVVKNRTITERVVRIMIKEFLAKEYLADICKIAILKYYAGKEVDSDLASMLKEYLCEMSEKRMVFPFYLDYEGEFLREIQLHDKVMVEYRSELGGKVKIHYNIQKEDSESEYHTETLLPMYENVYVKEFVLYEGEHLSFYFEEKTQEEQLISEKAICRKKHTAVAVGKYGKLNQMMYLPEAERLSEMLRYKREEHVAKALFPIY
ncbi:MAG: hypothetical protein IJZ53_04915 [Tyzzerella sp.]|nr:hypothetical protein [Tyzzerella sp.]